MTIKEQILEAGYKEYPPTLSMLEKLYQKCFTNEFGKKFYLNAYEYSPSVLKLSDGFAFEAQFETPHGAINIESCQWAFIENEWHPVKTLKDVESFFEKLWLACGGIYYEKYE